MHNPGQDNPLDSYLKKTLASDGAETFSPFPWDDVQVLLNKEKNNLPMISRKQLGLVMAGIAGILLLSFFTYLIYDRFSSLPPPEEQKYSPLENSLNLMDSIAAAVNEVSEPGPAQDTMAAQPFINPDSLSVNNTKIIRTDSLMVIKKNDSLRQSASAPSGTKKNAVTDSLSGVQAPSPADSENQVPHEEKVTAEDPPLLPLPVPSDSSGSNPAPSRPDSSEHQ